MIEIERIMLVFSCRSFEVLFQWVCSFDTFVTEVSPIKDGSKCSLFLHQKKTSISQAPA